MKQPINKPYAPISNRNVKVVDIRSHMAIMGLGNPALTKETLMDFINNNADLVVWSVILAPFAYIGLKLALVMAYIIVAGIFGDKR